MNGATWLHPDSRVAPETIAKDARTLADYLASFRAFFGNGEGAIEVYWAFLAWLYCAPFAPYLRQAAIPVELDPWYYPVFSVLYGRSSAGKTVFAKVAMRSMFGFEKTMASSQFTASRALGLRHKLGAIPLLIDDVTRDRFTDHVPDLVRTDQEPGNLYAPIIITTNRDVRAIPPDITKRMVTCRVDASIPEDKSVTERIAKRTLKGIGTELYRAYLLKMLPQVTSMRAQIDAEKDSPDLLLASSQTLLELFQSALGATTPWMRPLSYGDYFEIRHRRFKELIDQLQQEEGRFSVNPHGEIVINFNGDVNGAAQFAKTTPDFVFKERFGDTVKLDKNALEQVFQVSVASAKNSWWRKIFGKR